MPEKKKKDSRLERAGVSGYNKPKRTPSHPKKSHVEVAKEGDKIKVKIVGQRYELHDEYVSVIAELLK